MAADKRMWEQLQRALSALKISSYETTYLAHLLAAVLHLGNLEFSVDKTRESRPLLRNEHYSCCKRDIVPDCDVCLKVRRQTSCGTTMAFSC